MDSRLVSDNLYVAEQEAAKVVGRLPFPDRAQDADDVRQDAVLGLIDAASKYDPSQRVPFGAYARIRARGAAWDGRRAKRRVVHDVDQLGRRERSVRSSEPTPDEWAESEMLATSLRAALLCLLPPERAVIEQLFFDGRTGRGAAKELAIHETRVSQLRYQALAKLRKILIRRCPSR